MESISVPWVSVIFVEGAMFAAPTPSIVDFPFGQSEYSRIQTSSTMFANKLVGTPESITAIVGAIVDTGWALGEAVAAALGDGDGVVASA